MLYCSVQNTSFTSICFFVFSFLIFFSLLFLVFRSCRPIWSSKTALKTEQSINKCLTILVCRFFFFCFSSGVKSEWSGDESATTMTRTRFWRREKKIVLYLKCLLCNAFYVCWGFVFISVFQPMLFFFLSEHIQITFTFSSISQYIQAKSKIWSEERKIYIFFSFLNQQQSQAARAFFFFFDIFIFGRCLRRSGTSHGIFVEWWNWYFVFVLTSYDWWFIDCWLLVIVTEILVFLITHSS